MVAVKLYKQACVPCQRMEPVVAEVVSKLGCNYAAYDIAEDPIKLQLYDVPTVPALLVLDNDGKIHKFVGVFTAEQILKELV